MTDTLDQLARTNLLPSSESAAILSGRTPPLSNLIQHLVIASMDAEALTSGDKTATWTQRRIARQLLGLTFMTALLLEQTFGPKDDGAAALPGKQT
jgi:hypothetical protein